VTAVAGGIGLLTGAISMPVDMLARSPFRNYKAPGLALLGLVGGTASSAAVMTARRQRLGAIVSADAGAMIVGFEIVEVLVIGSRAGVARALQTFYFAFGGVLLALALPQALARREARPEA
jgi:hypothetical protein